MSAFLFTMKKFYVKIILKHPVYETTLNTLKKIHISTTFFQVWFLNFEIIFQKTISSNFHFNIIKLLLNFHNSLTFNIHNPKHSKTHKLYSLFAYSLEHRFTNQFLIISVKRNRFRSLNPLLPVLAVDPRANLRLHSKPTWRNLATDYISCMCSDAGTSCRDETSPTGSKVFEWEAAAVVWAVV